MVIEKTTLFLLVSAMVCAAEVTFAAELVVAENGRSPYRIVVADNASPSTRRGAEELQIFLEQMTGAKLPIVSDQEPQGAREIILGDSAHLRKLGVTIDWPALGAEGYVVRTVGEHLVIAGGQLRGNMYGVYGFLEDHLGCRWFTPTISRIPKHARLAIGPIDDRQIPAFEYRESFFFECFDGDWCARNRIHSSHGVLEEKHGGTVNFSSQLFCHTFYDLVPPAKYFHDHPEYFALVDGKRQTSETSEFAQLCCTNPEVIRICTERILQAMRDEPDARYFSVSQNDGPDGYCRCETCQKLAHEEDSQMAPLLQLVNCVAEAAEREFPDKIVETLAYEYGRRPPKHMRPRSNVLIRLCASGPVCLSHPYAACDDKANKEFCADVEGWAKITPRLWAWDYVADFVHFLLSYPNLRTLGPNVRFFAGHHVKGYFAEGADNSPHSDFAALKGYVIAKLLWNPKYDADLAMNEFLDGYYVKAAEPIRTYIKMLHDHVEHGKFHVTCRAECDSDYFSDELLLQANDLWRQAEELAASTPEVLQRVKESRMSADSVILDRARLEKQQMLPENAAFLAMADERFKPFCATFRESSLTNLDLVTPLDKEAYLRQLTDSLKPNNK